MSDNRKDLAWILICPLWGGLTAPVAHKAHGLHAEVYWIIFCERKQFPELHVFASTSTLEIGVLRYDSITQRQKHTLQSFTLKYPRTK